MCCSRRVIVHAQTNSTVLKFERLGAPPATLIPQVHAKTVQVTWMLQASWGTYLVPDLGTPRNSCAPAKPQAHPVHGGPSAIGHGEAVNLEALRRNKCTTGVRILSYPTLLQQDGIEDTNAMRDH